MTSGPQASWDPMLNGIRAFGFEGTTTILPLLRQVAADARVAPTSLDGARLDRTVLERLGATLLGESWAVLTRMIGDDLAVEMLAEATRTAAHDLVDPPFDSGEAVQAMQPGQFDTQTPVLAAARDVFGERLWRYRTGRRPNETGIDARLDARPRGGAVVGARRARDRVRTAAGRPDGRSWPAACRSRAGDGVVGRARGLGVARRPGRRPHRQ